MTLEGPLPIHDMVFRRLPTDSTKDRDRWLLPGVHEPWLRRYGEAEVIRLAAGVRLPPRQRKVADEVWALLEGEIELMAIDQRPDSPTRGAALHQRLSAPTFFLLPFGVRLELGSPGRSSWVVRMATHTLAEDSDSEFPPTVDQG
jgi:hypothetical protein